MEPGAPELTRPSAERTEVGLSDRGCHRRSGECRRIEPLIHIMRTGVGILSLNFKRIATESGSSGGGAWNGSRLPVLQRENPVGGPSPKYSVHYATTVMQEPSPFPNRQLITPTQVKHFIDIEVAPAVVRVDAESRQERCSVRCKGRGIENINRIGQTTRPGEVGQNAESGVEPVLIVRLQPVVVAIASEAGVG